MLCAPETSMLWALIQWSSGANKDATIALRRLQLLLCVLTENDWVQTLSLILHSSYLRDATRLNGCG